jgi:hypothetical protein
MTMKRFWDKSDDGKIEARLRDERPTPSQELIDRISGEIPTASRLGAITRTRKGVAVAFASLMLASTFGAAAIAATGGNNGGSSPNGTPAGCVEGNGQVDLHNPNC